MEITSHLTNNITKRSDNKDSKHLNENFKNKNDL